MTAADRRLGKPCRSRYLPAWDGTALRLLYLTAWLFVYVALLGVLALAINFDDAP